jgi:hypothetical protein
MRDDDFPAVDDQRAPPVTLWRAARWGCVLLASVIAGLVAAVALGVSDPKPIGSLQWEERWQESGSRWETFGERVVMGQAGLEIDVGKNELGGAVTRANSLAYTFEVAAGQAQGAVGAAYGIVVGYQGPASYLAVLINGNGYVEVVSADGREWMAWQQWPNILLGYEANRVRMDVRDGQGVIRINDEVLMTLPAGEGGVGVIARGSAGGQRVRFGWAKYWGK